MKTTLHTSPFATLGASVRDDRGRILQLAEDRALELDEELVQAARGELTNPRTRLTAELAWLPGVAPARARQLLELLDRSPEASWREKGLPPLARLNLLVSAFATLTGDERPEDMVDFIQDAADVVEEVDAEAVLRDLNADRALSRFPELRDVGQIEEDLADRSRALRRAIKEALDRFPSGHLANIMTDVVEITTIGGEEQAPALIDALVDSYEAETAALLDSQARTIAEHIEKARNAVGSSAVVMDAHIQHISNLARRWDRIAQPIQLSHKSRGMTHSASDALATSLRELSLYLHNNHQLTAQAQALTAVIAELFAELPDWVERAEADADALEQFLASKSQSEKKGKEDKAKWEREIHFSATWGLVFRDTLELSAAGITWKGNTTSLQSIDRVRWGGVRSSSGARFTIAYGAGTSETVIILKDEKIFDAFVAKLWKAVGVRMVMERVEDFRAGKEAQFPECVIRDEGISLRRKVLFMRGAEKRLSWRDIETASVNGDFIIAAKGDSTIRAQFSFRDDWNIHILAGMLTFAQSRPGISRLSDIFG